MNKTILFLCPHNATKSSTASSLLQKFADQRNIIVKATSAGTDPAVEIPLSVIHLLKEENIDICGYRPRRVTLDDLTRAWRVVTLGCNLGEMSNEVSHKQECWDDVPPPSQDLATAKM